jgi:hypothetical protein
MAAQKATELRRLVAEVEANEKSLRDRQEELEKQLVATPAATWPEAAEKARYLLGLLASTAIAQDPRRRMLIANVLEDFVRLSELQRPKAHRSARMAPLIPFCGPTAAPAALGVSASTVAARGNRDFRQAVACNPHCLELDSKQSLRLMEARKPACSI